MSSIPIPIRSRPGFDGRSTSKILGLYDGVTFAPGDRRSNRVDCGERENATELNNLLNEFLDAGSARRFLNHTAWHAKHAWKPKLALVIPAEFSLSKASHRRDLVTALELFASITDHFNLEVVSDSPDASRLFREVLPFKHEVISKTQGALVLLSRTLNRELGAICPSRYVTFDPCAHQSNKQRIVFTAGDVDDPFVPVDEQQFLQAVSNRLSVFIDEDEQTPTFLQALLTLREQGIPLLLTLSSRADDDIASRIRAGFATDSDVEIRLADVREFDCSNPYQLTNEPTCILRQSSLTQPSFLYRDGRFWRLGELLPSRNSYYLFRGEELNAHTLLRDWLGPREPGARNPSQLPPSRICEPLVSIIVSVQDQAMEVVRLAHSIYLQSYPWIEVVFVSHGSPPESLEAIRTAENLLMKRKFRVRVIQLGTSPGSAASPLDLGIRSSDGDVVCTLKVDDWLDHDYFEFLRRVPLHSDTLYTPHKRYLVNGVNEILSPAFEEWPESSRVIESTSLLQALVGGSQVMYGSGVCLARTLYERTGGLDHRLTDGEYEYLWCLCARVGANAEVVDTRVNITNDPSVDEPRNGQKSPLKSAINLALAQELIQWL